MDPMRERLRSAGPDFGSQQGPWDVDAGMDADRADGNRTSRTGTPDNKFGPNPAAVPAPDPTSLSVQLPSPRGPSGKHQDWVSSHDKKCEPPQAPSVDRAQYDEMTWDQLHDQCSRRGFRRAESKAVLKTG